jgi:hypothetical protein
VKPESYYAPRRTTLWVSGALVGGLSLALWRGATQWLLLLRGIRRHNAVGGLWNLEWSVIKGALLGAVIGGAIGWLTGFVWERQHRRRRRVRASRAGE